MLTVGLGHMRQHPVVAGFIVQETPCWASRAMTTCVHLVGSTRDQAMTGSDSATMPMRLVYDRRYVYAWSESRLAQCWLRVYKAAGRAVVIATEVDTYPRPADSSRIAVVASHVYRRFGLPLDDTIWVAHVPARGACIHPHPNIPEQFEEVTFAWTVEGLGQPQWQPLQRAEIEAFIGQLL